MGSAEIHPRVAAEGVTVDLALLIDCCRLADLPQQLVAGNVT